MGLAILALIEEFLPYLAGVLTILFGKEGYIRYVKNREEKKKAEQENIGLEDKKQLIAIQNIYKTSYENIIRRKDEEIECLVDKLAEKDSQLKRAEAKQLDISHNLNEISRDINYDLLTMKSDLLLIVNEATNYEELKLAIIQYVKEK